MFKMLSLILFLLAPVSNSHAISSEASIACTGPQRSEKLTFEGAPHEFASAFVREVRKSSDSATFKKYLSYTNLDDEKYAQSVVQYLFPKFSVGSYLMSFSYAEDFNVDFDEEKSSHDASKGQILADFFICYGSAPFLKVIMAHDDRLLKYIQFFEERSNGIDFESCILRASRRGDLAVLALLLTIPEVKKSLLTSPNVMALLAQGKINSDEQAGCVRYLGYLLTLDDVIETLEKPTGICWRITGLIWATLNTHLDALCLLLAVPKIAIRAAEFDNKLIEGAIRNALEMPENSKRWDIVARLLQVESIKKHPTTEVLISPHRRHIPV